MKEEGNPERTKYRLDSFERWFDKPVRNKMAGPALCLVGVSVGFLLIQMTRATPVPYDRAVGHTGVCMLQAFSLLLFVTTGWFCVIWLQQQKS
jgi:hypothetical protein